MQHLTTKVCPSCRQSTIEFEILSIPGLIDDANSPPRRCPKCGTTYLGAVILDPEDVPAQMGERVTMSDGRIQGTVTGLQGHLAAIDVDHPSRFEAVTQLFNLTPVRDWDPRNG